MTQDQPSTLKQSGYLPVGELKMYYEIHGAGEPLVLLHGGIVDIAVSFKRVIPVLAQRWQVIAVEQQAHGHTADVDRPLTFEQMAEDTAAALQQLGIQQANIFGHSDGGNVAFGLALRYPNLVRKIAVAGTNFNNEGLTPGLVEYFATATAEEMGPEMRDAYAAVAPDPANWPTTVAKVMQQAVNFVGWQPEQIQGLTTPVLFIIGDADIIRPEHAVEMVKLLPQAHLAVLPNTDHFMRLDRDPVWLLSMIEDFFGAPMPEATST